MSEEYKTTVVVNDNKKMRAILCVSCRPGQHNTCYNMLKGKCREVYRVFGEYDFFCHIYTEEFPEVDDVVFSIKEHQSVAGTKVHMVCR